MALFAGVVIGVGATCFLYATYASENETLGRVIGGTLFALGIFAIIAFEMRLFTGMVANIPSMHRNEVWQLPVCFLFNALGVIMTAALVQFTPLGKTVIPLGATLIEGKLADGLWTVKSLVSGVFCGVLITMSILAPKYAPQKGLSTTLGVMLPIVVFAFCGFDHSVANMFYFYSLGEISWRVVGYIALTVVGNILGGTAFPLFVNFKHHTQAITEKEEHEN
ncbi:MAG: formate/nitrite transporter family protein [Clostridia bacterium]|nr:formate/nitrite transporter family protein [Clostridia bacterium]